MGFRKSVDVAHTVTEYLARQAIELSGGKDVEFSVIIDNVLFCATQFNSLLQVCNAFHHLCCMYNVTIGEASSISRAATFRLREQHNCFGSKISFLAVSKMDAVLISICEHVG